MNTIQPLRGIVPPLITPLHWDRSLDLKSLQKTLDHVVHGGVHGVFILGTTGESSSLSMEVKTQLITATCSLLSNQIPVLVGITDCSFSESLQLASIAQRSGAFALVAAPPFYMNIGQEELVNYYSQLADQVSLPVFLYNMPSHTKVSLEIETVLALSEHPNIIGIKDSSANGAYFQSLLHLLRHKPHFTITVGPEEMLAETVLMGGHGAVAGGANLFPKLYVSLYEAALRKDFEKIHFLQRQVMEVSTQLYNFGNCKSSYLRGVKASCELLGLSESHLAPPLYSFSKEEYVEFKKRFERVCNQIDV
jgi:4-hydroxy-tetrahydrodipicolinate synthase